jgi:UDPglucose 6-dehydrogenase
VILCQVPPGFTRSINGLASEHLYYQVETLVFGRAVERATKPERYIIGCAAPDRPLDPRFKSLLSAFSCPILPMRYESAELAKIAINCCLVASIGVANTLAELSEEIGADWSEIAPALKLDERIGPKAYLSPGLGIAGGNLERDLQTVIGLSEQFDTDSGMIAALLANSRRRKIWAAKQARKLARPGATLAVWGLAYKENTHSIKNSPSLATIEQLQDYAIVAHDPVVSISVVSHPHARATANPLDACDNSDILMILTPWPQYKTIAPEAIAAALKGKTVLDPFQVLDPHQARAAGLDWHTLGVSFQEKA